MVFISSLVHVEAPITGSIMPTHEVTRRDILAAAAAGLLAVSKADADAVNDSPADLETRRRDVEHLRCELAREHLHHPPIRQHQTNGDEENLKDAQGRKTYLGNYSKGLIRKRFGIF